MQKLDGKSLDIVEQNIEQLKELFPEVFSEGKIKFDQLQELLGNHVAKDEDHYNFTWHGKRKAGRLAQTPSTGTLRPAKEESVDWDTTQNLFIEGDNLEVLKLLQKSYHRKVKMIYIDPPYNTGNDFVYEDDFKDGVKHYLELTGQVDGDGKKIGTNSSVAGRYHTNWLNMMYPRLKLARNLLREDGLIFISIDDNEITNLRKLCDEIFGEANFFGQFTWETKRAARGVPPTTLLMTNHEYVVCYAKSITSAKLAGLQRDPDDFSNPDNDPRGLWRSESMKATGSQDNYFTIKNPDNGMEFHANWAFSESTVQKMISEGLVLFPSKAEGTPRQKKFIDSYTNETKAATTALGWHSTERSTKELMDLFDGKKVFDFPKPLSLVSFLCEQALGAEDLALDFFAGSASTAQAIMQLNAKDGGRRKCISVQLPEMVDNQKSDAYKDGYKTITDISKERIRRAAKKIKEELVNKILPEVEREMKDFPQAQGHREFEKEKSRVSSQKLEKYDLGFKVFKLDTSNIKRWEAGFDSLNEDLLNAVDYIKKDRSQEDVLYELLLKYGLDLTVPIEVHTIASKTVYSIGLGALVVCLDDEVTMEVVNGIGQLKEELKPEIMRVVFKDDGFKDDVVKTNALQTLKRFGIEDIKSL